MKFKEFKVGSRVKYTSNVWKDNKNNPLWDGKYGKIVGTIMEIDGWIRVLWDNERYNSYNEGDIELIEGQRQLNLFGEDHE